MSDTQQVKHRQARRCVSGSDAAERYSYDPQALISSYTCRYGTRMARSLPSSLPRPSSSLNTQIYRVVGATPNLAAAVMRSGTHRTAAPIGPSRSASADPWLDASLLLAAWGIMRGGQLASRSRKGVRKVSSAKFIYRPLFSDLGPYQWFRNPFRSAQNAKLESG